MLPVDPKLIAEFKGIAKHVTTEDVMETALEIGCHYATVQRYLQGKVKKEKIGKNMLEILKGKIMTRESNIAEVKIEKSPYNCISAIG